MNAELQEITDFIERAVPLRYLSTDTLAQLTTFINITYVRKEKKLELERRHLLIVRSGVLNHFSANGALLEKISERELLDVTAEQLANNSLVAEEDSLIYLLDYEQIETLLNTSETVMQFFEHSSEQRVSQKMSEIQNQATVSATLSNRLVEDCYHGPLTTISADSTVVAAAKIMSEKRISSLGITENNDVVGIITDKDIRRRFVAEALPYETPVSEIMTRGLLTIDSEATAYDALMMMMSKHIHHIPVTEDGEVVGMVTSTDLMKNEGNNTVNITSMIHKAKTPDELAEIAKLLPRVQIRMTLLGTKASHVTKSISAMTMAITHRLITLALNKLGEPPVPFAWVGLGSQARQEQLIHTDQDTALILSDDATEEDDAWFYELAKFVTDGLNDCGFEYCPGDVMATNTKWRQTQSKWLAYFKNWVNTPEPMALMHSSIFFDMKTVYGDPQLVRTIRNKVLELTRGNTIFLAHMTKNALSNRPPLGFFRDFVLISEGEHKSKLDIKHSGIAPIVDLARIYALGEAVPAVNTIERLEKVMGSRSVTESSARSLVDAMDLLSQIRLEHQTRKLQAHLDPDNYLELSELSRLERQHLKDAFKIIKTLQDSRQSMF